MGNQICVISIYVPDITEALHFYTETLGFTLDKRYGPKIVSLLHKELPIILEESKIARNDSERINPGIVLALRTEDIDKTTAFLRSKQVSFVVEEPTECPPGKFISFKDPFGNVLEYLQFRNK
ncbi:MAG: VOC family protein [Bacillus sp. (in: firmicutes)]